MNSAWGAPLPPAPGEVPGAASIELHKILAAPPRPGRILGVFPSAVYLALDEGSVVAVCAVDAVRLPNSVLLAAPRAAAPFAAVRMVDTVRVGSGALRIGPLAVQVTRWWAPRRPRPPRDAQALRAGLEALLALTVPTGLPDSARVDLDELVQGAAREDLERAMPAAARLVGLGPGLTPSGDDILSGFLMARRHLRPVPHSTASRADALAARIAARAIGRTTALSAALLGHAARGNGCPQLADLIDAVAGHAPVQPCLERLLSVGHTSGADLALGVAAAARAVLDAVVTPHHPGDSPVSLWKEIP